LFSHKTNVLRKCGHVAPKAKLCDEPPIAGGIRKPMDSRAGESGAQRKRADVFTSARLIYPFAFSVSAISGWRGQYF
jgi:hypothetical protein